MVSRRSNRARAGALLAVVLPSVAALPAPAGAQLVFGTPQLSASVFAGGFTQVGGGFQSNVVPLTTHQSSTATSAHADLSGASQQTTFFGSAPSQIYVGSAAADGVADATYGGLHFALSAGAVVSPYCYGCGGVSPGVLGSNPYVASVRAGIAVGLTDWLQVTSTSLPVGAPVTFDYGYDFHRMVTGIIGRQPWSNSYWSLSSTLTGANGTVFNNTFGSYNALFGTSGWLWYTTNTTFTQPIAAHVGDVFQMSLGFAVELQIEDGYNTPAAYNFEAIDASNTLSVVLQPQTPGLAFRTASGFDYVTGQFVTPAPPTTSTPEPGTLALLATGVLALGALVRTARSPRTPS